MKKKTQIKFLNGTCNSTQKPGTRKKTNINNFENFISNSGSE